MGSLGSQTAKQIGEIAFHQQDLIGNISQHRCSLIHQLNIEILIGRVGAGEQRDPLLPVKRMRPTDTDLPRLFSARDLPWTLRHLYVLRTPTTKARTPPASRTTPTAEGSFSLLSV